jgi:hypothetical protein
MLYKEKYLIKQMEEKDLPAVKELFLKVFQKKVSINYLKNKYNTSYIGIRYICSIAYHKEKPIAFYGAIPQKFSKKKQEILVAHACDSYTLKNYQGQGLHYELAKFSYQIMKEKDIKFVYAFHSENTYQSTKKLEWEEYTYINRFHLKIKTLPISKILNKLGLNNAYKIFYESKTSRENLLKIKNQNIDNFKQVFNTQFISYKNNFNNHYFIKIEGCIFWVKIDAIMLVGLFYAPDEILLKSAIQKLKIKAFFLGIPEIIFQIQPYSSADLQLQKVVVPKKSWLIGYLKFDSNIKIDDFTFTYSDLDTY